MNVELDGGIEPGELNQVGLPKWTGLNRRTLRQGYGENSEAESSDPK